MQKYNIYVKINNDSDYFLIILMIDESHRFFPFETAGTLFLNFANEIFKFKAPLFACSNLIGGIFDDQIDLPARKRIRGEFLHIKPFLIRRSEEHTSELQSH